MSRSTAAATMFAALLTATALAGCFQNPDAEEPTYTISRAFTIDLDSDRAQNLGNAEGPEEFVRRLVSASLVVRVGEPGDYTLTYTDSTGKERTETLTGLAVGVPRTVAGVDVFTNAALSRGDAQVATRAPIAETWWKVGDIPLGIHATAPAAADYAYRFDAHAEINLENVQSEDANVTLESLNARLALPILGDMSWKLEPGLLEDRLDLTGSYRIDDATDSLALLDARANINGEAAEAGIEVRSGNAELNGGFTWWLKDGQLVAGQFQGGAARASPDVVMWATGAAAEEGVPCSGKARADACKPEELPAFDEHMPADDRFEIDASDFRADDEEGREALRMLQKLLAQDLAVHDSLTIQLKVNGKDMGMSDGASSLQYLHEVTVPAQESVTVAAGTFQAYRIIQTATLKVDIDSYSETRCEEYNHDTWECATETTHEYVKDFHLDETLFRTTTWLDAASYMPLKVTVESPLDLGEIVRDMLGSAGDDFWSNAELKSFDPQTIDLKVGSTATFEATRVDGEARIAPYLGFLMSSLMSNGGGASFGTLPMMGSRTSYDHAVPVSPPEYPMRSLSIASNGPLVDGTKEYVITSASPDASWADITITVDGEYRGFAFQDGECGPGATHEYAACDVSGRPEHYVGTIEAGDTLTLTGVEAGETLRFLDSNANAVILTLVIG